MTIESPGIRSASPAYPTQHSEPQQARNTGHQERAAHPQASAIISAHSSQSLSSGGNGEQYTVAPGDNLWAIAQSHGVSLQSLINANPQIANPNLIFPGQHINIPRAATGAPSASPSGPISTNPIAARNDAAIAESFLGDNASSLKQSGALPMDPNVPSTECCANFVSAVLQKSGLLPSGGHTDSVSTLNAELRGRGWQQVSSAQAKPGDVVIVGGQHTEIVASNNNGKLTLIGSNNVNSDGTQRISYDASNWAWQNGGIILAPPNG